MSGARRPRLLVAESRGFPAGARALLARVAELELADLDRPGLLAAVGEVEVLWVRLRHRIDREVLGAAGRLEVLATPTTGLTHVDLGEAAARGVEVLSLRGELELLRDIRATAEHTVGLMLALLRHLPEAVSHVRGGGWNRDQFRGGELFRRTVGVVGHGRLGRIVSRYLLAFGSRVLTTDPAVGPERVEAGAEWVELPELLAASDIVTVHVDHRPETENLIDGVALRLMRPGALLVNTSRGELVDEEALLGALADGRLGGAAVDVLRGEDSAGMAHHPLVRWLREHRNLIVTPHIGGSTTESLERVELHLASRLAERLQREDSGTCRRGRSRGPEGTDPDRSPEDEPGRRGDSPLEIAVRELEPVKRASPQ